MTKDFVIMCDVTCDLNDEMREKFGVEYVHGYFTWPDGTQEKTFLNWSQCEHIPDCTSEKFYDALKKEPNSFSTACASPEIFAEAMEPFVKEGKGILFLTISGTLSGTFQFVEQGKKTLLEKYPEAQIRTIDSRRFASGLGLLAIHASLLREQGKTLDETAAYLEENKNRFHQAGWLDDLSFVAKKGRLTNAKAFFGTLVGVKPIGEFDSNGLTTVIAKAKGEKGAYKALIAYIEAVGEDLQDQVVLIAQSNRRPQAENYKKLIEEKFSPKAVYICDVFPANGVNVGPGLMAAYFMGKPISEGLTEEREIMAKIIAAK